MKLRTELEKPQFPFRIGYKSGIFSIGSCFSVHIADRLEGLKYRVMQNPCGITFNPASLLSTIKRVEQPDSLHESQLIFHQGLYSHYDFHGSYNDSDPTSYLSKTKASLHSAQGFLSEAEVIFITIGTCHVYRAAATGEIVNNCHKQPSQNFTHELLQLDEVISMLTELADRIRKLSTDEIQFVWTVSPVRHTKNGLVKDRQSKSIALLAIDAMVRAQADCHYFPSYEIMTDDLRDYRFYKEDLIHPSDQAVDYIFQVFEESLLSEEEKRLRQKVQSIVSRSQHRPLFPDSKEHQHFTEQLASDKRELQEAYPFLQIG